MTLDAHVTGIWCGQIGGGCGYCLGPWTLRVSYDSDQGFETSKP